MGHCRVWGDIGIVCADAKQTILLNTSLFLEFSVDKILGNAIAAVHAELRLLPYQPHSVK